MSLRPERIADYLKKEISNIILQKVRDPRLKSIVINHISVTQDISLAKVFYSVYQNETQLNEKILSKFSGMIRSEISKSMKIRRVPKIVFIFDKTPEEADNIENLLKNNKKINISKFPIINSVIKIINGSPPKKEIKILLNRKFKNE